MGAKMTDSTPRPSYHHGQLRETLIRTTLEIIEQHGIEHLSIREVAKKAGVSPAAPFRHFPNRTALLTAVAEEATERLRECVQDALRHSAHLSPIEQLRAIGHAYLKWATTNPTHFRVVSDRTLIDYAGSKRMQQDNEKIKAIMRDLLEQAHQGKAQDIALTMLLMRAFVYGLARMFTDGHLSEWAPDPGQPQAALTESMNHFMTLLDDMA